jgi:FMN-dependent NADH-azoreductase
MWLENFTFIKPLRKITKDNLKMKLLHIVATPRTSDSNTLKITQAFIDTFVDGNPGVEIDTIELFRHDLSAVAGDNIEAKYHLMIGGQLKPNLKISWGEIEKEIERFLRADIIVISSPMWNFSIPYALKYYIDTIVQPGYLFKYNELGQPIALVHGKQMVCVTTRGGDYSVGTPMNVFDFQEPYLRAIFGFVGITDIHFINSQPMDITREMRDKAINIAIEDAKNLAQLYVTV